MLDRVLRRRHQERVREGARDAVGRDLALLHRLQQCRLGLRRRAVDLVGEDDVREDRPLAELELARPRVVDERARHVAGHEVGRELDALGVQAERRREGAHQERLGDTGNALEEEVPLGEEPHQDHPQKQRPPGRDRFCHPPAGDGQPAEEKEERDLPDQAAGGP